ncbi:MAG: methylmalonyl-CoA epimerase [Bacteroidetes bacterium]|nr:methylmalonyl-CoA epimerase [Bacteroidota bacterium]
MKKLEHIGIAVKNLEESEILFAKLLGTKSYKREAVESEGVITSFFLVGNVKIELLSATHPESPIAKFIEKKGEGIHHLAFEVEDIDGQIENKKAEGFELISKMPKDGADNKRIAFLHPKSTGGVLTEMCEEKKK